jgi:hypothetical protein
MKFLALLLVVATLTEGFVFPDHTAYGYLARSVEWVEKARQEQANPNGQRIVGGSAATLGQFPYQVAI